MTGPHPRSAREVVEELFRRQRADDDSVLDDLVATDMVNHAAGPQGRVGLKTILRTIEVDLGPTELEQHEAGAPSLALRPRQMKVWLDTQPRSGRQAKHLRAGPPLSSSIMGAVSRTCRSAYGQVLDGTPSSAQSRIAKWG